MRLNNIPDGVRVFGDPKWRGKCPTENVEQATVIGWLRREWPDTIGALVIHPRNEQQLRGGQHRQMIRQSAEGMTPGASDIIIPGAVTFVCELKRRDRTLGTWQPGQVEYLDAAAKAGAFACVALGHAAAMEAVREWLISSGVQA